MHRIFWYFACRVRHCWYGNSSWPHKFKHATPFCGHLALTLEEPDPQEVSPHELFRACFYNYFSYLGYVDLPLKTVDQKLSQAGLTDSNKILELRPEKLRKILDVDAVIRGRVLSANNFTGGIHAETSIKAKIDMLDLRTGDILWETEHREMTYSGIRCYILSIKLGLVFVLFWSLENNKWLSPINQFWQFY